MMRGILIAILILWLFGIFTNHTLGGLVHLLLLLALIVLLIDVLDRSKAL